MVSRKADRDDPPSTPADEQIRVVGFQSEREQDDPGPVVLRTASTDEAISEPSDHPQPTRPESNAVSRIEEPSRARQLRCCSHPLFAALENLAESNQHHKQLLLEIAWRMHFPPSLRALPIVARNIWRSLVMLRYVFDVDLEELGVSCWLRALEWMSSDSRVLTLTQTRTTKSRNLLMGHCASTHPLYTVYGEEADHEFDLIRSLLTLLYIESAEVRVALQDYERHVRHGAEITLKGHSPDEAWRAMHFLAGGSSASKELLGAMRGATSLEDLVARISNAVVPDSEDAIRHWSGLKRYVRNMWLGISSERRTSIAPKLHVIGRSSQNRANTSTRHISYTVHGPSGSARITRYIPPLSGKKRRELAANDIPPDEDPGTEILFIVKAETDHNVEKSVRDARFRTERRMLHRPVDLLLCHERNLTQDEIGVLFRDARKLVQDYRDQGFDNRNLKHMLEITAGLLVSFFTRSEAEEVCEVIVLSAQCQNAIAEIAIFLADELKHDYFRIKAIDYEYRSDKFETKDFRQRSGYVYLPLPPIVSLIVRTLLSDAHGQISITEPTRLVQMDGSQLETAIRSKLKRLDPTGRLTPGRLERSFFARLVAETGGDLAVTSMILAKPHPLVHAELYYLAIGLRSAAGLYQRASRKIHEASFPDWMPDEAPVDDFVTDLDVGCRYYPVLEQLSNNISKICDLARDAWARTQRKRNIDVHDLEFERDHNMVTLALTLMFSFATGVRAVTSPLPRLDDILEILDRPDKVVLGIADWVDKDNSSRYHKRELIILDEILKMLRAYGRYLDRVRGALPDSEKVDRLPAFFLAENRAVAICPKSIAKIAGNLYPYPPNTHRRVLARMMRAGILEPHSEGGDQSIVGCSAEIIRAGILGHWTIDQEPWSELSNLPLRAIEDALLRSIPQILRKLGFVSFMKPPGEVQ